MMQTGFRQSLIPFLFTLGLLLMGPATTVLAGTGDPYQSHASIRTAAREFVLGDRQAYPRPPQVSVGRLDSRLRLARCTQRLHAFAPPGRKHTGKTTIGVRCDGSKPWTLYVPVTVRVMGEVVVSSRELVRGAVITPADVHLEQRDLAGLHSGYLNDLSLAVGKRVKRTLRQGRILKPTQIVSVAAIKKGAAVTILASSPRLSIRTKGKALGSGGPGDRIRVRNLHSKKILEATVVNAATVQVDL